MSDAGVDGGGGGVRCDTWECSRLGEVLGVILNLNFYNSLA